MKKLIFTLILSLGLSAFAQQYLPTDLTVLCSDNYKTHEIHNHDYYELCLISDDGMKIPEYVMWTLTKEDAETADNQALRSKVGSPWKRCGNSSYNAIYSNSGYDRGHMCPAEDRDLTTDSMKETFKFCNVCPQSKTLNEKRWLKLEALDKTYAETYGSVDIVVGPVFFDKDSNQQYSVARSVIGVKKQPRVAVPDGFFRVFYNKENSFMECYILYEDEEQFPEPVSVELSDIEKATGLKFIFK